MVPFPAAFREALALHIDTQRAKGAGYLFESSWKKPYSTRGVRKLLTAMPPRPGSPIRSARIASGTSC
jgi:integrase/recombinase XerD